MIKYILICVLLISACSLHEQQGGLSIEEKNKYIVYNMLGPFEIDSEKDSLTQPLITIQNTCYKNNFLEYRHCFLKELASQHDAIIHTSRQEEFFQIFSQSLQQEVEYYPYYQKLGEMRYPERDLYHDEVDCFIVGTGSFRTEYAGTLSESSIAIQLSYASRDQENLGRAFPTWKKAQKYDSASFTGNYYDPNHPCLYRTFGPAYGNIIFTKIVGDDIYIFIKVNEGAGSGEFDYSVFVYDMITKSYTDIGSFGAWSGIIPFEYNFNLEKDRKSPIDIYENRPFLYYSIAENRRIHGDTVELVFKKSIQ